MFIVVIIIIIQYRSFLPEQLVAVQQVAPQP